MPKTAPQLAKLSRPRLYDPVPRERLFSRLDTLHRFPFVWLSGPPGSGKTSLFSSWLDARKLPFVWYQVDAGDPEPATAFWFLTRCARHDNWRDKPLPNFAPDHVSDVPAFARRFFRGLCERLPHGCLLVFDNCHEAAIPSFHAILEQASTQLPEG